jgi:hypothetical protein
VRSRATKTLLAPVEDVWAFLSEPYNFRDWWPRLGGVQPDRRGFARGARWTLIQGSEPGLINRPNASRTLLIRDIEPFRRFAFHLARDRLDVDLLLEPLGHDHTKASLEINGPFLLGWTQRTFAKDVLNRLYELIQTAPPASN